MTLIAFVRHTGPVGGRVFGPKPAEHPGVGMLCPACGVLFVPGDYTTLVPLGPGDDLEAQERAAGGQAYNAVAIEVHYRCATGSDGREEAR